MVTKLFVGNLSRTTTEEDLSELFSRVGTVASIEVVTVPDSNMPRHFAFIDMSSPYEAERAIRLLNGSHLQGRPLKINIARPRERRPQAEAGTLTKSRLKTNAKAPRGASLRNR